MAEKSGKVGAVYAQTGTSTTITSELIGKGNGGTTVFYLRETVIDCEATSPSPSGSILEGDWTSSGAAGQDAPAVDADEKEGTYSIKNNVTSVSDGETSLFLFTIDSVQDWSDRAKILFWMRCEAAQSGFENARFEIEDGGGDTSYWDLTFAADTWTRQMLILGEPDGNDGAAADLTDVKIIQLSFEASGSTPFWQLIDWIGLTPQGIARTGVTINVDGSDVAEDTYVLTPSGKLTLDSDPGAVDIVATYNYYEVAQTTGFFGWNFSWAGDVLETTDYSDSGIRTYIAALKGWTASAERHWLSTETMDGWLGTERIVKFFTDASTDPQLRYEGWAIITGDSVTSAVDTLVNESLSFQGCGLLSYVDE